MNREPVALSALITTAVAAVLAMLVGLDLIRFTPEQTGLVVAAVTAVVALAGGIWARARVTPTADPRSDTGQPLIVDPEGRTQTEAEADYQASLARATPRHLR